MMHGTTNIKSETESPKGWGEGHTQKSTSKGVGLKKKEMINTGAD